MRPPVETLLVLGCGAGFDCFLAVRQVGKDGKVIGVDMTPEMIHKDLENAHSGGFGNLEFRLGEIEHLPAADRSIDVIISNCLINLSPDKPQVFRKAYRVLKTAADWPSQIRWPSGTSRKRSERILTFIPPAFQEQPLLKISEIS